MLPLLVVSELVQSPDRYPILLFIRFNRGGFGHYLDTRMVKVRRSKVKCNFYVFQSGSVRELGKVHYHEPVKASKPDGVPVTLIRVDALLKFVCVIDITCANIVFPLFVVCRIGSLYLFVKL